MTGEPAADTCGLGAVVLDIEGTTTPISFVHDVLFRYARSRLRNFLRLHADALGAEMQALREEWSNDVAAGEPVADLVPRGAVNGDDPAAWALYLDWLMLRDRKSPALKVVQGRIWEDGYRDGTLRGAVYDDVRPAFERWRGAGIAIAIYSSGSVLAQRLLFSHSTAGDLSEFIQRYFDTGVGPKRSADSYRRILAALGRPAGDVLFVSDVPAELSAAEGAGLRTLLCVRPDTRRSDSGEAEASESGYEIISTFDEIRADHAS